MKKIFVLFLILALFTAGCQRLDNKADDEKKPDLADQEEVSEDISEIGNIEEELNTSEIDDITQGLDDISW